MAYTFKTGKMASNQLDTMLTNGVKANAAIKDGSLITLGKQIDAFAYQESGIDHTYPEYDTYAIEAPAANKEICVVDYAGIQEIGEENYKMGIKLYNLKVPAGYPTRVRRLALHDKYWIGNENIAGGSANLEDKLGADADGLHNATGLGTFKVQVIGKRDFTVGMHSKGTLYLVEVIAL